MAVPESERLLSAPEGLTGRLAAVEALKQAQDASTAEEWQCFLVGISRDLPWKQCESMLPYKEKKARTCYNRVVGRIRKYYYSDQATK
jgi:hypothetical protein